MKKILTSGILMLTFILCHGQVDWNLGGNNGIIPANGDMLGTTDNSPLPIVTDSLLRMIVKPGTGGQSGQIGIGNNLATSFVPQQRFHLHQGNDNNDNYIRWSNGNIGNMTGFDVGLRGEFTLDTNAAIINNRLNTPMLIRV